MAVELLPAVLATTASQLKIRAALAQKLSSTVHLDVMDGKFVTTKSVGLAALQRQRWHRRVEVHAMIDDPITMFKFLEVVHPRRVYLHVELGSALLPFIALLRSRRIEFGLAINPQTNIHVLKMYIRYAQSVLVMSVQPGRYQAPFWPGSIARVRTLKKRWPKKFIAIDGGMNERTIPRAVRAGARRIIVGSDVMLNPDPITEWRKLKALSK